MWPTGYKMDICDVDGSNPLLIWANHIFHSNLSKEKRRERKRFQSTLKKMVFWCAVVEQWAAVQHAIEFSVKCATTTKLPFLLFFPSNLWVLTLYPRKEHVTTTCTIQQKGFQSKKSLWSSSNTISYDKKASNAVSNSY